MTKVFVDSGYLIALDAEDDQHHATATRHWPGFRRTGMPMVTTSLVVDEVITWFSTRGLHTKAVEIGRRLMRSPSIELVHADDEMFNAAFEYLARRSDKRYSFTDCVSFVLMSRLGIQEALAFDGHFAQAGFVRLPLQ